MSDVYAVERRAMCAVARAAADTFHLKHRQDANIAPVRPTVRKVKCVGMRRLVQSRTSRYVPPPPKPSASDLWNALALVGEFQLGAAQAGTGGGQGQSSGVGGAGNANGAGDVD